MEPDSTSMLSPAAVEDHATDNGYSAVAADSQANTGLRSHLDRARLSQSFHGQTTETDSVKLCSSIDTASDDAALPMTTQSLTISTGERSDCHPMDDDSVESGAMSGVMLVGDNGVLVSDTDVGSCHSGETVLEAESFDVFLSESRIDRDGVQSNGKSGSRSANVLSNIRTPDDQCSSVFPTTCTELVNVDSCNHQETVLAESASLNESAKSAERLSSAVHGTPAALPTDVVLPEDSLPSRSPAANDGWSM